jgi:hypothetical protein
MDILIRTSVSLAWRVLLKVCVRGLRNQELTLPRPHQS